MSGLMPFPGSHESAGHVDLCLAGDVVLSDDYRHLTSQQARDLFSVVPEIAGAGALVVANLEGTVMPSHSDDGISEKIRLPIHERAAGALASGHIHLLCLANNHLFDFGLEGYQRTAEFLGQHSIRSFGAGESRAQAGALHIENTPAGIVGFIGRVDASTHPGRFADSDFGVVRFDIDEAIGSIRSLATCCTFLVVSVHWGAEHLRLPSPEQVRLAKQLVDAGADVVYGHHAHVFQGAMGYRGSVIFFGMGNLTVSSLEQALVKDGQRHTYAFRPGSAHREGYLACLRLRSSGIQSWKLHGIVIGADGAPRRRRVAFAQVRQHLFCVMVNSRSYAAVYAAYIFLGRHVLPRLRFAWWLRQGRLLLTRVPFLTSKS